MHGVTLYRPELCTYMIYLPLMQCIIRHVASISANMFVTDEPTHKKKKVGRPQDEEKTDAFLRVARFLQENDDEQISVSDLIDLMNDFMADSESTAYGHTHMKAKIKEHFGDQIIITELNGRANVVTFRSTAETVLQEFHARQKDHPEQEKQHIIETAAKLIKNDIKLVDTSNEHYPTVNEIREFKQIATAGATTAAVTEKVWGEYVASVCQTLQSEIQRCQEHELRS